MATTEIRKPIAFATDPARYRHWRLEIDPPIATLTLDVDEQGGLHEGYVLKLNSYDLGVDIELADAVQRLRFEHPEVRAVIIAGGKEKVFCAGANIGMLAQSAHGFKVNFCKFTNETRLAIEDATANSGQTYLCALNGSASGGGYEFALACEHITLVDDGSAAVSLPELPLLAVLPGTGGLTRLVDKRGVRRDIADAFATRAQGVKGGLAKEWRLVDDVVPRSRFTESVREQALQFAEQSDRPADGRGLVVGPHEPSAISTTIDRDLGVVNITIEGPEADVPAEVDASFWPLRVAYDLDALLVDLRFNEPDLGTLVFRTQGDPEKVARYDAFLLENADDWLVREVVLFWKRTLKRLDLTSRSVIALVEPQSCFVGSLFEIALAADRSYMFDGSDVTVRLTGMNLGPLPGSNGLTRLETRFIGTPERIEQLPRDEAIDTQEAVRLGLVTFAPDDLDWDDEVRVAIEERASFSPDALTAMEQNLRFAGPETMETKIFGRLSCWQNWVFSRPNATGAEGALPRYGTGQRAVFDRRRV